MKDDKSLKKEITNMAMKAIIISTLIMIVVSVIADTGLIENPVLKVVVLGIIMILSFYKTYKSEKARKKKLRELADEMKKNNEE